jgi:hypothetical protein
MVHSRRMVRSLHFTGLLPAPDLEYLSPSFSLNNPLYSPKSPSSTQLYPQQFFIAPPKMNTATSNVACNVCTRPVPAGLLQRLLHIHTTLCPLCLMRANVLAVRDSHAALKSHPQIEAASDTTSDDEKNNKEGDAEEKAQKERKKAQREQKKAQLEKKMAQRKERRSERKRLIKQRRLAKVNLHNAVDLLEQLQSNRAEVQWNFHLIRALNFWERSRDECTTAPAPGYKSSRGDYISANDSPSKSAIEKESSESGDPVKSAPWQSVKATWHNARTSDRVTKPSSPNKNTSRRALSNTTSAVLSSNPEESSHASSSSLTTPPTAGQITPPASPPPILRSCLKRQRTSCDPDSEPRAPKKARIDETATIQSGGLAYTRTSSTRTHSSLPAPRRTIRRKSRHHYKPSTWAPAHPHAFVDTSCVHVGAHVIESLQANIEKEEQGEVKDFQECRTCPDLVVEPMVHCGECLALQWHKGREEEWQRCEKERRKCERERVKRVKREAREEMLRRALESREGAQERSG